MAVINFIPGTRMIAEGTNVDNYVPLRFTLSEAQQTDIHFVWGIDSDIYLLNYYSSGGTNITRFAAASVGALSQQDDISGLGQRANATSPLQTYFDAVIPAGQTEVTLYLKMGADNQIEFDERFNIFVSSIEGESNIAIRYVENGPWNHIGTHGIAYEDTLQGQIRSLSAGGNGRRDNYESANTYMIVNDDATDGVHALFGTTNDVYTIPEGNTQALFLGSGDDTVYGSSEPDVILAHDGTDRVFASFGNDIVNAGAGDDQVYGGWGDDIIFGRSGADGLYGDGGDDIIQGQDGSDALHGGGGNDQLDGGGTLPEDWKDAGDVIYGEGGSDAIAGREGNDYIVGGTGADFLEGGAGQDLFAYNSLFDQGDIITDFGAGPVGSAAQDAIDLRGYFDAVGYAGNNPRGDGWLFVFQNGTGTDLYLAQRAGDFSAAFKMVTLWSTTASTVDDGHFIFQ